MEDRFRNICLGCHREAEVTREELEDHRRVECSPYQKLERALAELNPYPLPNPNPLDPADGAKGAVLWCHPGTRDDPAALKAVQFLCAALGEYAWMPLREKVAPIYYREYQGQDLPRLWEGPVNPAEARTKAERAMLEWTIGLHPLLTRPLFLEEALRVIQRWSPPATRDHATEIPGQVRRLELTWEELPEPEDSNDRSLQLSYLDFQVGGEVHISLSETADEFRKRAEETRRRAIEEKGLERVRTYPLTATHFRWFVERVIFDMAVREIEAADPKRRKLSRQTITHGVNTGAQLLGIGPPSYVCPNPNCGRTVETQREMREHVEECTGF
ncbi:MAG: hypothetical protein ACREX3_05695 [Gammaproteobacteria bacterium]